MSAHEAGAASAPAVAERDILEALKHGGIEKENLAELVKIVGRFHGSGARVVKVFPLGIPYPDGVNVHTITDLAGLERLVKLLSEIPRFHGLEVFPKGIPKPDVFVANIQLR